MSLHDELERYLILGLRPIPLRFRSKRPLVRWGNGWNPSIERLQPYFAHPPNVKVLYGESLAVIDCDSENAYISLIATAEAYRGLDLFEEAEPHQQASLTSPS